MYGCFGNMCTCIYCVLYSSGLCDRASLTLEKKEPTDDTSIDVYSPMFCIVCTMFFNCFFYVYLFCMY